VTLGGERARRLRRGGAAGGPRLVLCVLPGGRGNDPGARAGLPPIPVSLPVIAAAPCARCTRRRRGLTFVAIASLASTPTQPIANAAPRASQPRLRLRALRALASWRPPASICASTARPLQFTATRLQAANAPETRRDASGPGRGASATAGSTSSLRATPPSALPRAAAKVFKGAHVHEPPYAFLRPRAASSTPDALSSLSPTGPRSRDPVHGSGRPLLLHVLPPA